MEIIVDELTYDEYLLSNFLQVRLLLTTYETLVFVYLLSGS